MQKRWSLHPFYCRAFAEGCSQPICSLCFAAVLKKQSAKEGRQFLFKQGSCKISLLQKFVHVQARAGAGGAARGRFQEFHLVSNSSEPPTFLPLFPSANPGQRHIFNTVVSNSSVKRLEWRGVFLFQAVISQQKYFPNEGGNVYILLPPGCSWQCLCRRSGAGAKLSGARYLTRVAARMGNWLLQTIKGDGFTLSPCNFYISTIILPRLRGNTI